MSIKVKFDDYTIECDKKYLTDLCVKIENLLNTNKYIENITGDRFIKSMLRSDLNFDMLEYLEQNLKRLMSFKPKKLMIQNIASIIHLNGDTLNFLLSFDGDEELICDIRDELITTFDLLTLDNSHEKCKNMYFLLDSIIKYYVLFDDILSISSLHYSIIRKYIKLDEQVLKKLGYLMSWSSENMLHQDDTVYEFFMKMTENIRIDVTRNKVFRQVFEFRTKADINTIVLDEDGYIGLHDKNKKLIKYYRTEELFPYTYDSETDEIEEEIDRRYMNLENGIEYISVWLDKNLIDM